MDHKLTYKNPDGTLQEVAFDDFDSFADSIDMAAQQYYSGVGADSKPVLDRVETIYQDGLTIKEKLTTNDESNGPEYLSEWTKRNQEKTKPTTHPIRLKVQTTRAWVSYEPEWVSR